MKFSEIFELMLKEKLIKAEKKLFHAGTMLSMTLKSMINYSLYSLKQPFKCPSKDIIERTYKDWGSRNSFGG